MAEWKGTKTDWETDDGVDTDNFNRIEGNIQYNYENVVGLLKKAVQWKSGRYKGDRENDRFINVGFTPDIVMIVATTHPRYDKAYGFTHGFDSEDDSPAPVILITKNHPAEVVIFSSTYNVAKIVTNGFRVSRGANIYTQGHQWVALKIGN